LIAVAINRGVVDEQFYSEWMRSSYTTAWDQARPYVRVVRVGDKASFVQFEKLARKWGGQAQ
jgi:hypothetical protein